MSNRPAIRHVVFFSANNKTDIPQIVGALSRLSKIPGVDLFEVRENSRDDELSGEVDIIVYAEFASASALAAYKVHALYHECIDIVRPLRDLRIAADF